MAIIRAVDYNTYHIETGDPTFDEEFKDMLTITKEELVAAILGEGVVDKLWSRIQRIRTQKHEQMMKRIQAEQGNK